ncbi:MAG: hypothetical protein J6Q85_04630 [Clostridia bacterium]|nr:hypothetical protein [Clostridia bacterium]
MKNYDYGYGFKPISAWGYVGYSFLWSIPLVGFIIWLCHAIGAKNQNVKNYARSAFCAFLLALIVAIVLVIAIFVMVGLGYGSYLEEAIKAIEPYLNNVA